MSTLIAVGLIPGSLPVATMHSDLGATAGGRGSPKAASSWACDGDRVAGAGLVAGRVDRTQEHLGRAGVDAICDRRGVGPERGVCADAVQVDVIEDLPLRVGVVGRRPQPNQISLSIARWVRRFVGAVGGTFPLPLAWSR